MAKRTINDKYEKGYVDLDRGTFVELLKDDIKEYKLSDILFPFNEQDDPSKQRYFEMTIKEVQPDYEPGQQE